MLLGRMNENLFYLQNEVFCLKMHVIYEPLFSVEFSSELQEYTENLKRLWLSFIFSLFTTCKSEWQVCAPYFNY